MKASCPGTSKSAPGGNQGIDNSSRIECFCCLELNFPSDIVARLSPANRLCLAQQRRIEVVVK